MIIDKWITNPLILQFFSFCEEICIKKKKKKWDEIEKKWNEPINGTASLVGGVISATILKKNTMDSKIVISANNLSNKRILCNL